MYLQSYCIYVPPMATIVAFTRVLFCLFNVFLFHNLTLKIAGIFLFFECYFFFKCYVFIQNSICLVNHWMFYRKGENDKNWMHCWKQTKNPVAVAMSRFTILEELIIRKYHFKNIFLHVTELYYFFVDIA